MVSDYCENILGWSLRCRQGYTEVELDAACASCDVDGSHMINKKELAKLSRELSRKQQVKILFFFPLLILTLPQWKQ